MEFFLFLILDSISFFLEKRKNIYYNFYSRGGSKMFKKSLNKNAFTLVELLAVIVILSILMAISVPNIISTLDRNKKVTYIGDAKKLIALARNQLGNKINKPGYGELVRVNLSCLDAQDLPSDPEGNPYDEDESFVVIVRKNEELIYYVNLIGKSGNGKTRGIYLTERSNLDGDRRMSLVKKDIAAPTDDEVRSITGVSGIIRTCGS